MVNKFFDWLQGELDGLTEIVDTSGDYCARIYAQSLLEVLDSQQCEHLHQLGMRDFKFPEGLGSVDCDKTIESLLSVFFVTSGEVKDAKRLGFVLRLDFCMLTFLHLLHAKLENSFIFVVIESFGFVRLKPLVIVTKKALRTTKKRTPREMNTRVDSAWWTKLLGGNISDFVEKL